MNKFYQFDNPVRMIEGRYGFMVYNQFCQYIGKALENYGEYCEHEQDLFRQFIKPNFNVWEIGANTGSQSVALSRMCLDGNYVGFEPQIELYKIFTTNLTLNNCSNARSLNFALGEYDGVIELPAVDYKMSNNFGAISLLGPKNNSTENIEIKKIDNLLYLPQPDFLKIDVEGMEKMVLLGGYSTIQKNKPIIYIENDRLEKSSELIGTLWDLGYECYWHITTYYNTNNFFQNHNNIYQNTSSFNMLCFHKDKSLNVNGLPMISDKNHHPLKK